MKKTTPISTPRATSLNKTRHSLSKPVSACNPTNTPQGSEKVVIRPYQDDIADKAVKILNDFGLCYLSMECRTGKTLTAFLTADRFGAKSVLFVTKIKAVPSVKSDYALLNPSYSLEVVNYESVHKCSGEYDFIILDEAHCLGAYPKPSKRTIAAKEKCKGKPVLFLSGTPTPESYSQIYHQLWCSDRSPFAAYKTFYKWAVEYVNKREKMVNGYRITDYSDADKSLIDEDASHLFVSYTQGEAGFSTNIIEHVRKVPMPMRTSVIWHDLYSKKVAKVGDHVILGDTPAKLLDKLHQISGGTVIAEDGTHLILDTSKCEYVKQKFAGKKLALFYCYQSEFDLLKQWFPNWTDSPEEFQASSDKVFICQVRRAREGVRLDTAEALVFYSFEYSFLSYEQGRNRLVSKEREEAADVYFLCSVPGLDETILEAVHGKKDFTLSYYRKKMKVGKTRSEKKLDKLIR